AAVGADRAGGAFVLDAAERGALHRHRIRIEGIDLDYPAEAVRLVRVLAGVEAVVIFVPASVEAARREAIALLIRGNLAGRVGEVDVPVLFAGEIGAPRRPAVRAAGVRAEADAAARVSRRAHERMAGGLSANGAGRAWSNTAGVLRVSYALLFVVEIHLDHRN